MVMVSTIQDDFLFINADNSLWYENATDDSDGTPIDTGTMTARLLESDKTTVVATGIAYTHVGSGTWYAVLEKADVQGLTENDTYYVEITFASSGREDFRLIPYTAVYRGKV